MTFGSILVIGREAVGAARSLLRRPAFASLAIALFALGVGAVSAVFSVVNGTMLRPLPYASPERLVKLVGSERARDGSPYDMPLGYYQLVRYQAEARAFERIEGYTPSTLKLLEPGGNPEPLVGALITAGFFENLGARPALGSMFTRAEEIPQAGVVVISHRLWMRRFGGDPAIIGRTVNIDEAPSAIVGVMPADFEMPFLPADAWMPLPLDPVRQSLKARLIVGVARMKEGISQQQAIEDIDRINSTALAVERPDEHRNTRIHLTPLREAIFGDQRAVLLTLLIAGCLLLAVATVNVVSLCMGDAVARKTATMTRLALGATRAHILRLRLLEVGVIAAVGATLGLLAGRIGISLVNSVSPDALASLRAARFDFVVIGTAVAVTAVAALVAGVPTALQEAGYGIDGLAGSASRTAGGRSERRRADALIIAQVSLAVILLVGASLLGRNVRELLARPTGFRTEGVSVVELTFSPTTYKTVVQRSLQASKLIEAVKGIPGVSAAATIQTRFVLAETMQTLFEVEGRPAAPGEQHFVNIRHVTPEVGEVLGLSTRSGRMFTESDRDGSLPVAVVSTAFARQHWPGEDPIGRRVRRLVSTGDAPWMEVIGVVDDIKDAGAGTEVGPILFVSYLQQNTAMARPTLVVRSNADPATLFPALRQAIWSVDANQTIDSIRELDELMLRSAAQPRFAASVAGLLAVAALILVLGGIYAVTLYSVLRRTREIGLRAALGAGPRQLLWASIQRSVIPVWIGAVAGAVASIPAGLWMRGVLAEGVSLSDAPVIVAVLATITVTSILAALIPARRALRIPPALAMRDLGG